MRFEEWEPIYLEILREFGYSRERDEEAARTLDEICRDRKVCLASCLRRAIGRTVTVCGNGPGLERQVQPGKLRGTVIAADGATSALLRRGIVPDMIVSDLDGDIADLQKANRMGAIMVIHAHGDNIDKIKKYVPKFKGEIVGTTQINPEPYDNIHNLGGFTDGDRAVYLADHFHAKKIYLIGFDFKNEIGPYSFSENKNKTLKLKKLKWCKNLINMLNKKNISYF
jgi:uncharacterized Rossmann fold enzyme